eukprot:1408221-Pyramimonas_sp.AAC.1
MRCSRAPRAAMTSCSCGCRASSSSWQGRRRTRGSSRSSSRRARGGAGERRRPSPGSSISQNFSARPDLRGVPPEPRLLSTVQLAVWPRTAGDLRASLGPSRGDRRASRELRAAFCPALCSP